MPDFVVEKNNFQEFSVQEHTIRVIFNELAAQCFLFHEKCTNVLDTIDQKNMSGFPLFKNIITDYFEVQNTK